MRRMFATLAACLLIAAPLNAQSITVAWPLGTDFQVIDYTATPIVTWNGVTRDLSESKFSAPFQFMFTYESLNNGLVRSGRAAYSPNGLTGIFYTGGTGITKSITFSTPQTGVVLFDVVDAADRVQMLQLRDTNGGAGGYGIFLAPEPSTWALMAFGAIPLGLLAGYRRRKG